MIGVAFFGGPFIWIMILITHLAFRRANERPAKKFLRLAPPGPWSSLLGIGGAGGGVDFHVVGAGISRDDGGGAGLAGIITVFYMIWSRVASEQTPDV